MRAKFGRMIMCHMIADTEDELHAMADRIGVARRWHQGDHYDIPSDVLALAVPTDVIVEEVRAMHRRPRSRHSRESGNPGCR